MGKVIARDNEIQPEVERRVLALADKVETYLDLGWITWIHKFDPRCSDDRVLAEVNADWEYRQASIIWNVAECARMSDEVLEVALIHEIVHHLLAPIWDLVKKQSPTNMKLHEFVTECLARAIFAARESE